MKNVDNMQSGEMKLLSFLKRCSEMDEMKC